MHIPQEFTGLGMPVFNAFGWAGEETARQYALEQLRLFISILHKNLLASLKEDFPISGLNEALQSVYLAAAEDLDSDVLINFNARPTSLELEVVLSDKAALSKALKQINKAPGAFQQLLSGLGAEWTLRIEQVHVIEEAGDQGHYQDIYKDSVQALDAATAAELFEKAAYLNSEDKWVVPIYLSQRTPAEQIAAMKQAVIAVMLERLDALAPIIANLRGRSATRVVKSRAKTKAVEKPAPKLPLVESTPIPDSSSDEGFTYVASLMPLHVRRGFINMTPEHWPFFALNARTESRPVIVITPGTRDEESAVWRLQPDDMARLVLGPKAHRWLEDNFVSQDNIALRVRRVGSEEIEIHLSAAA